MHLNMYCTSVYINLSRSYLISCLHGQSMQHHSGCIKQGFVYCAIDKTHIRVDKKAAKPRHLGYWFRGASKQ